MTKKERWQKIVREQEQWVAEHGGDLPGYITNYHRRHGRPVAQARAIYEADVAALAQYKARLERFR